MKSEKYNGANEHMGDFGYDDDDDSTCNSGDDCDDKAMWLII